jgi:hypothetical protein
MDIYNSATEIATKNYHCRTVESSDPDTMRAPSGLNCTALTTPV